MVWDKTVMTVMKQWDYGKPERGVSVDKSCFFASLSKLVTHVEPVWFDDYLEDLDTLQVVVQQRAEEINPDLIFFVPQHTNEFELNTLKALKSRFITAVWFGDDEWRFDKFSSIIAPYFNIVISTDPWSVDKYEEIGIHPIVSAWAAQPHSELSVPENQKSDFKYDVSFIGGANEVRTWFLRQLRKEGIKVECFGAGWKNGRVSYEEMFEIFNRSRINLNLSNSVNDNISYVFGGVKNFARWLVSAKRMEQIKARNFEIPMAGGFQLTNYVPHLERYWEIGKEIIVYVSPSDCVKQIDYHLKHEDIRLNITKNGFIKARSEHTFEHRLTNILKNIWG